MTLIIDDRRRTEPSHLVFSRPIGQFTSKLAKYLPIEFIALEYLLPYKCHSFVGRENPDRKSLG